jgi:hypothetical protein
VGSNAIQCRYGRQIEDIEVRNSLRCIIDDAEWARRIYDRVRAHIPDAWRCRRGFEWEPVSVNERLRFLRYEPGQYFRPHYDVRALCVYAQMFDSSFVRFGGLVGVTQSSPHLFFVECDWRSWPCFLARTGKLCSQRWQRRRVHDYNSSLHVGELCRYG